MTLPWLIGLGPVSSQELLKLGKGGGRGARGGLRLLLALGTEGTVSPRNAGGFGKPVAKTRAQIVPGSPRGGMQTCRHFDFVQ